MTGRRLAAAGLLVVAIVVVVIIASSGGSSYVVKMRLADAAGLRQGSPVAVAGQDVGHISLSVVHRQVVVKMMLTGGQGPVGRDASASVASVNLLGQKRIELDKGNVGDPAPSGYTLPASRVSVTADLDQVVDVLTPDVRARLGILIDAAGQAFLGRRADFGQMLAELPSDFRAGTQLLAGISGDNHTLGQLVQHADGFVSHLVTQRGQLVQLVKSLGQASATVQAKRAQLAATLDQAPGALATLQGFLGKLQRTTVPLGPAAADIARTAPALDQTLAQLDPFRTAADPTLREATSIAPELTRLAAGATPVVARATPVVASLASFSHALTPVTNIVNHSVDNLVAILQNWSRAIQFRDGLSHVFRGEATITPQIVESMLNQLQQAGIVPSAQRHGSSSRTPRVALPGGSSAGGPRHAPRPASQSAGASAPPAPADTTSSTATSGAPAGTTPPPASGASGSSKGPGNLVGDLLSFLLGP